MTADTTNPHELALDAIPDYREAEAALARLDACQADPPEYTPGAEIVSRIVTAAYSDGPFPTGLGQHSPEAANAEKGYYLEARRHLAGQRAVALRRGAAKARLALRPMLDDLIAEARELAPGLRRVSSAGDAEEAGPEAEAAWGRLSVLARQHAAIRTAQGRLTGEDHSDDIELAKFVPDIGHVIVPRTQIFNVAGWLSNLSEVWPDWSERLRAGRREVGGIAPAPWPGGDLPANFADPTHLLWLVTATGQPWLPTVPEMVAVYVSALDEANRRRLDADELRRFGHVRDTEERRKAMERAEARRRQVDHQIELHQRRAAVRLPVYDD
jgi:hypothetical protein